MANNITTLNMKLLLRRAAFADTCVLAQGEPGYHTTTKEFKIGDGTTAWKDLPIANKSQLDLILQGYKTKQDAVSSPNTSGKTLAFIDTISQDANGKITATKKNVNLDDYVKTADLPDTGVMNVGKKDGTAISVDITDPDNPKVGLTLNNSGKNVTLSQTNSGLSASIDLSAYATIGASTDAKTASTVHGAKAYAKDYADTIKEELVGIIDGVASAGLTRSVVTALPAASSAALNTIYMIKRDAGLDGNDYYDEYIVVEVGGVKKFELLGNTELDLSNYYTKSDVYTKSQIDAKKFKTQQTAVTDPTAAGNSMTFISSISQDTNGVITAAKSTVNAYTKSEADAKFVESVSISSPADGKVQLTVDGAAMAAIDIQGFQSLKDHANSSHVTKVSAGNDDIAVSPASGTGAVTVSHKAYGSGTYQDVNHNSDTDPSFVTGIQVTNGHVTGATVKNLRTILESMIIVLDGGTDSDTVELQIL